VAKRKRKPKTPAPPRSGGGRQRAVQAPQVRTKKRTAEEDERRKRILLYALGASGIVGLAIVAAVIFVTQSSGGGSASIAADFRKAGCTYRDIPGVRTHQTHVSSLKAKVKWPSSPPANGRHYFQPARWDFYTEPVNPLMVVHNEEHGGLIVWYGRKVSAADVEKLRNFYSEDPVSMLVTPYKPFTKTQVAISAWTGDPSSYNAGKTFGEGHLATCRRLDDKVLDAFRSFRDEYKGHGPEGVPENTNQPGT
jgi:hypothetical protein